MPKDQDTTEYPWRKIPREWWPRFQAAAKAANYGGHMNALIYKLCNDWLEGRETSGALESLIGEHLADWVSKHAAATGTTPAEFMRALVQKAWGEHDPKNDPKNWR